MIASEYTVDCRDYVDYWYFGSCGLWIQWIAGIMDIVDYIYRGLQGTIVSHHRMLKLSSLVLVFNHLIKL